MTLWELKQGDIGSITFLRESMPPAYRTRLTELGFQPGGEVTCVLSPSLGAPHLFQVDSCIFSLDKQTAECIEVVGGCD